MTTTRKLVGTIVATPDVDLAAREAAGRMAEAIRAAQRDRGRAVVALSGGNTPRPALALLAKADRIDWGKLDVFFVDERAVPPDNARSNYRMANEAFFTAAPIPPANVVRMHAEDADRDAAAKNYEREIRARVPAGSGAVPAFDLVVLGIGDDGHTASLFPGRPEVEVADRLVVAVPSHEGLEPRLTMTPPLVEHARGVLVHAVGGSKHGPLERVWAVAGSLHETPSRIVRAARGAVVWILDHAALMAEHDSPSANRARPI
jgi:6-phosphogluconolactonase